MTSPLHQGRIVWVMVNDPEGRNPKCRPAVILTPTQEIDPAGEIVVVAASSTFNRPLPDNHIPLPWKTEGHPKTKLHKACIVVCEWLCRIPVSHIQSFGGLVPDHILNRILSQIRRLENP